jgi:hypothetical protein
MTSNHPKRTARQDPILERAKSIFADVWADSNEQREQLQQVEQARIAAIVERETQDAARRTVNTPAERSTMRSDPTMRAAREAAASVESDVTPQAEAQGSASELDRVTAQIERLQERQTELELERLNAQAEEDAAGWTEEDAETVAAQEQAEAESELSPEQQQYNAYMARQFPGAA